MFGWLRKKTSGDSPFGLVEDGRFGKIAHGRHLQALEDELADASASSQPADRFLGLTIASRRFQIALIAMCAVFFAFAARAADLQLMQGSSYRAQAEGNRFRTELLPAARGVIYDRNGQILVENVPAFTLFMTIRDLPHVQTDAGLSLDRPALDAEFDRVADLASLQRTDFDLLLQQYADDTTDPIIVRKDLGYTQAMLAMIEEPSLPGFTVNVLTKRQYETTAPSLSHVLGYVGKISPDEYAANASEGYRRTDEIGKSGVERSMESTLRGTPGKKTVEVDAFGDESATLAEQPAVSGQPLTLAIDLDLQEMVESSTRAMLQKLGLKKASVVVIDPNNGEVLSLVSLPTFDSNAFAGGIDQETYAALTNDKDQPLFPRAIAGEFPPGSTFKPYVASAALASGVITPTTSFTSVGGISIGPWFFPDWKAGGHGVTDVRKAIAESVNTFFYIVGGGYEDFVGLGVDRITQYAKIFGFGAKTGIDLPGESDGFLPSKDWKEQTKGERWYVGDTYHYAIGQGDLLVTPIQMAASLAAVANGGTLYVPHVVHAIGDAVVAPQATELSDALKQAIPIVQQGMRQTVTAGSARSLGSLPYAVAGKTGTAQFSSTLPTHAWFTGFAPYDHPQIAVVVMIEQGGEGSSYAVPIAHEIFQWWYDHRMAKSP